MRTIIVMAALASAVVTTPVAAEVVSISVPFGDLDLSRRSGAAALERRVEDAIERLCGRRGLRPRYTIEAERECVKAARTSADEQLARFVEGRTVLVINTTR